MGQTGEGDRRKIKNDPVNYSEPLPREAGRERDLGSDHGSYMGHMGGCQNYGPFLGALNIRFRNYYNRDPKRDHNFDIHPHGPPKVCRIINNGPLG